jgi:signal transduction histidine kinase
VPPVHAMIASSLYLESCCALLLNLNIRDTELTMALIHLNSASQSLVIAGYSKQHSTNCFRLVERKRRRFSQDLHDEIGHNLTVLKLYLELMARDLQEREEGGRSVSTHRLPHSSELKRGVADPISNLNYLTPTGTGHSAA